MKIEISIHNFHTIRLCEFDIYRQDNHRQISDKIQVYNKRLQRAIFQVANKVWQQIIINNMLSITQIRLQIKEIMVVHNMRHTEIIQRNNRRDKIIHKIVTKIETI